eukprot:8255075-Alexandrium_andersonii.AAC.1
MQGVQQRVLALNVAAADDGFGDRLAFVVSDPRLVGGMPDQGIVQLLGCSPPPPRPFRRHLGNSSPNGFGSETGG